MQKLIFILLTVSSLFFSSCGDDIESSIPINTTINMNGLLSNFAGGKIEIKIFDDTSNTCNDFLDKDNTIDETPEKTINFDIPKETEDLELSETDVSIKPGQKTIYAVLYNEANEKRGHACKKAIKCSLLADDPLPDNANDIKAGDKACVYLDIQFIE